VVEILLKKGNAIEKGVSVGIVGLNVSVYLAREILDNVQIPKELPVLLHPYDISNAVGLTSFLSWFATSFVHSSVNNIVEMMVGMVWERGVLCQTVVRQP